MSSADPAVTTTTLGRGFAAGAAAVAIWGLVPVATRYFVLKLDPLSFNIIRFLFTGIAALPMMLVGKPWRWPTSDQTRLLLCAALAVPGFNMPVAFAARTLSAGHLGLLIATEPILIVLFASWLLRRPINLQVLLGAVVAFVGVLITNLHRGVWLPADLTDTALVLVGAASWSCYTVLAGSLARRYGASGATGAILVLGSTILIVASVSAIHTGLFPDARTTAAVGALGLVSSLFGFLLWTRATAFVPPDRLGLLLYALPLVSVLGGAAMLDERVAWPLLIGGSTILLGVGLGEGRVVRLSKLGRSARVEKARS
jgi:drug/metabolite transporter (DMT)-like permease